MPKVGQTLAIAQVLLEGRQGPGVRGVVGVRAGPGPGLVPVDVVEDLVIRQPVHAAILRMEGDLDHDQVVEVDGADLVDDGCGVVEPLVDVRLVDQVVADDRGLIAIARGDGDPQVLQALLQIHAVTEILEATVALIAPLGDVHVQDQAQPVGLGPLDVAVSAGPGSQVELGSRYKAPHPSAARPLLNAHRQGYPRDRAALGCGAPMAVTPSVGTSGWRECRGNGRAARCRHFA